MTRKPRKPDPGLIVYVTSPSKGLKRQIKLSGVDAVVHFMGGASVGELIAKFRVKLTALADDWRFMTRDEVASFEAL